MGLARVDPSGLLELLDTLKEARPRRHPARLRASAAARSAPHRSYLDGRCRGPGPRAKEDRRARLARDHAALSAPGCPIDRGRGDRAQRAHLAASWSPNGPSYVWCTAAKGDPPNAKKPADLGFHRDQRACASSRRDGGIRTRDPLTPSQVRYQAALRPGTARQPRPGRPTYLTADRAWARVGRSPGPAPLAARAARRAAPERAPPMLAACAVSRLALLAESRRNRGLAVVAHELDVLAGAVPDQVGRVIAVSAVPLDRVEIRIAAVA